MVAETKTIEVAPGSELARLLDEAEGKPLVLVKEGVRYRVDLEDASASSPLPARNVTSAGTGPHDPWADYDPDKLWAGIQAAAGSITEEEAGEMIANIYRWREEGTRPLDCP